ncbi:MAG: beta-ketoacyl-[acyl-carrier-protein] synthase family protein [Bacteroidales bacterium]|nr:MAG: beta-ketoacyl-[acyl-carrier-protein] synthase family protein [Bacteroidales bacterium]
MNNKIFITGIGIISAIGRNIEETLDSLRHSRSGVGDINHLDTIHKESLPTAEIKYSNTELTELLGETDSTRFTRSALLGMIAAREAATIAGIFPEKPDDLKIGVVSATTVGGMDKSEQYYYDFLKSDRYKIYIETHECSDSTEKIADLLNTTDYLSTISTACSSSANSIIFAAQLIRHGIVDRVVAGGTDALSRFTLNGFNALMILDKNPCRPFDKSRQGLNLGEGAGYVVLESEKAVKGRKIFCELKGYSNANDAYHQTASSPEGTGAFLSMRDALENSRLDPLEIDYINAHGTGTENNDLSEGIAIEKIFGNTVPMVSSTKPFTGHTLGAAGGVEAVISILSIEHQMAFPNLNFNHKMPELGFQPVREIVTGRKIVNTLSNSFGFGGNGSSLIFSKY